MLNPITTLPARIRRLWTAPAAADNDSVRVGDNRYRVLFTHGDDAYPAPYRSSLFDQTLERALMASTSISDDAVARAFAVSATGFACSQYEATTAAGIPLKVVDAAGDPVTGSPLSYFINTSPLVIRDTVLSLRLFGRVYLRKRRNRIGLPTGLEYVNPMLVREVLGERRQVVAFDVTNADYSHERLLPSEIIYLQDFDPQPFGTGLSRFEIAWRELQIEIGIATYAASFFVNGAAPDGFLTFDTPLENDEFEEARKEWRNNFKGAKNAHKTAVLPGGARWTAVQASGKDLALTDLTNTQTNRIHAIFQVNPALTGMGDVSDQLSANSTYSAIEVSHLRNVTLPLFSMLILPALNDQWARRDFGTASGAYTLVVDTENIPALNDANLIRSETAINLNAATILDYNESRKLTGFEDRADYLKRSSAEPMAMFTAGAVGFYEARKLAGVPAAVNEIVADDVVLIGGALYPKSRLFDIANKNADAVGLPPPSPFGSFGGSINPPPPAPPTPLLPAGDTTPALPATDAAPTPLSSPVLSEPLPEVRAGRALELCVSFADHQFLVYARRALSDHLTARQIAGVEYVDSDAWRLPLVRAVSTPDSVAAVLRRANYDGRKVDAVADGYTLVGDGVYLRVADNDALSALRKAAALDSGVSTPETQTVSGILLCRISADVNPDALALDAIPAQQYPLVAANVTLLYDGAEQHRWLLRGVSSAQELELRNWGHITRRSLERGLAFKVEALGDDLARWVRDALSADVDVNDAFDLAGMMLRGELELRAYPQTRQGFVTQVASLIERGLASEVDRRNFSAQMRVQLRRQGLIAFREGFLAGGVDNESFSPEETAAFNAWLSESSIHVTQFGSTLFSEGETVIDPYARAEMWANKSLDTIYYKGLTMAAPTKRYQWKRSVLKDSCETCIGNHGQVDTLENWQKRGLPRSSSLRCGGWFCGCVIEEVKE